MKIINKDKIKNNRIILLQGENGRKLIKRRLEKEGFKICLIECYKRVFKILDTNMEVKKWRSYKIDTLVVTNSESLHQLKNIISSTNQIQWLFGCRIFVVGKRLFRIAKKLGWNDVIVSKYANNDSFIKRIKETNFKN
ncbi:uroporphyrinogen-III synthase [Buchnera aphidicola]|uniref:uroporphyrinogen-III synthase n=1 Tax=Buchnera aphidicola TaxID=9 RepID=UPI0001BC6E7F|nr:uroporphyrinogen-III synthase [Buchnera aphidicola]